MTNMAIMNKLVKQLVQLPVIILEPGNYLISLGTIDSSLFEVYRRQFLMGGCILVGVEGKCSITFDDNLDVAFTDVSTAHNINFHSGFTNCYFQPGSIVNLTHFSFVSSNHTFTSLCRKGNLKVDFCKFHNCAKGGLLIVGEAVIENSEFYGNGAGGLEVRKSKLLAVRKSKMYAKRQGLLIGPEAEKCDAEDCELFDNAWGGIVVSVMLMLQ